MKAVATHFIPWLMSLTVIMRYFVIALLAHVALVIGLGLKTVVVTVLPPSARFNPEPLPPPVDSPATDPTTPYGEGILSPPNLQASDQLAKGHNASILDSSPVDDPAGIMGVIAATVATEPSVLRPASKPSSLNLGPADGLGTQPSSFSRPGGPEIVRIVGDREKRRMQPPPGTHHNPAAERAVLAALRWLKDKQREDGSWECHGGPEAGTALALLAFLGHGETVDKPEFGATVQRALEFLVSKVQPNGNVTGNMYAQALVTVALAEGYAMSGAPALRTPLERAARFIVSAQKAQKEKVMHVGGWRYSPGDSTSDLSVSGWQIMALKSAANAGVEIPQETFDKALKYVWSMYGQPGFGYDAPATAPGMTAVGILCVQFLGHGEDERVTTALRWLRDQKIEWDTLGGWAMYFLYYATQAMFQGGEPFWPKWNDQMRTMLLDRQAADGHWPLPPKSGEVQSLEKTPVYATALGALMLETYYRYLPMYEVLKKQR